MQGCRAQAARLGWQGFSRLSGRRCCSQALPSTCYAPRPQLHPFASALHVCACTSLCNNAPGSCFSPAACPPCLPVNSTLHPGTPIGSVRRDCTGSMVRAVLRVQASVPPPLPRPTSSQPPYFCCPPSPTFLPASLPPPRLLPHSSSAACDCGIGHPEAQNFHPLPALPLPSTPQSNCIEQIKAKALDIFKVAPKQYPDATTRLVRCSGLAHCGYTDYCLHFHSSPPHAGADRLLPALSLSLVPTLGRSAQKNRQAARRRLPPISRASCEPLASLQAFVGYRDFYREAADAHFIVSDFVEANNFRWEGSRAGQDGTCQV